MNRMGLTPKEVLALLRGGGFPYLVRSHPIYRWFARWLKRFAFPHLSAFALLVAGLVLLSRALFATGSAVGFVCNDASASRYMFRTSDLCWASGIRVEAGKSYRITLTAGPPWMDGPLKSGLHGYTLSEIEDWPTRIVAALTTPLRRSIGHAWLQPIARIGAVGDDEYPLQPEQRVSRDSLETKLTAVIKARSDGELFLFVNDLVIGLPDLADVFYRNNRGTATVTVEPFREPGEPRNPASAGRTGSS
jgi:hypothetical protein